MGGMYSCYGECEGYYHSDDAPCVDINGHLYCPECAEDKENEKSLATEEEQEVKVGEA